jgi:hypothetical protein
MQHFFASVFRYILRNIHGIFTHIVMLNGTYVKIIVFTEKKSRNFIIPPTVRL